MGLCYLLDYFGFYYFIGGNPLLAWGPDNFRLFWLLRSGSVFHALSVFIISLGGNPLLTWGPDIC